MTENNGTALAVREPTSAPSPVMSDAEIDRTYRLAKALSASGFFKDARQAEQAFAKMLFGRDLGLSPTQAMTSIHIVEGKPELSANLQAQLVRCYVGPAGERYDYRVLTPEEKRDMECEIAFLRDGQEIGRERFTMEDAKRAGLAGRNVWKSYPRNMLFARTVSNGVAFHCPEVTNGLRVYHEGEISGEPAAIAPQYDASVAKALEVDVEIMEPATGEIVDEAEQRFRAEMLATAEDIVERELLPKSRLNTLLVAGGATDTSNVGAAIATMPRGQADELHSMMVDLLAAEENGAGVAAEQGSMSPEEA